METSKDFLEILESSFQALNGSEPESVKEKRRSAFTNFKASGFPTRKDEEYKYTDVSKKAAEGFSLTTESSVSAEEAAQFHVPGLDGNYLVFVNGVFSDELSSIRSANIRVNKLVDTPADVLDKYFSSGSLKGDPLFDLNTAMAKGGVSVVVPKGKVVEEPVIFQFINDTRNGNIFSQSKNLIVAEENSQCTLIETYNTLGENQAFFNSSMEINIHKEAHAEHYKVQNDNGNSYQVNHTQVRHIEKSFFSSATITLQGDFIRNNLNVDLEAEHCESKFYGLFLLDGKQHVDNHTLANHSVPNCVSDELYKGVLDGNSTGVFNGKILVQKDAQKTNAFQSNKNIVLSPTAKMNTKPQLEIFADDVKCSHGATVGQLDQESVFYLKSRGIPEKKAKALLMHAFAQDIIEHIKSGPLKAYLSEEISKKLSF